MPTALDALEIKADLMKFWQSRDSDGYAKELEGVVKRLDTQHMTVRDTREVVLKSLSQAIPYYVTAQIGRALRMASEDLPPWPIEMSDPPSSYGFVYFEEPVGFVKLGESWYAPIRAVEWEPVALLRDGKMPAPGKPMPDHINGFGLIFYSDFPGRFRRIYPCGIATLAAGGTWRDEVMWADSGQVKPDDLDTNQFVAHIEGIKRLLLASWGFAKQPYSGYVAERANRALRKRLEASRMTHEPEVKVIILRKAEAKQVAEVDQATREIEWSCSWIVRGHWRNQACGAGRRDHKKVYIMPFVKGDTTKPLKARAEVVYAVAR